ncbi:MAG: NADH-quinone oxidoreductase subunit C [Peptococcaceae bacterium]|nr:NADH-quinone oxidoreductase subunit C [Peptococcaceae bacterium]
MQPEEIIWKLKSNFPGIRLGEEQDLIVKSEDLISIMTELKDNQEFSMDYLTNLTAVDYQEDFRLVYNLFSLTCGHSLMLKVVLLDRENPEVPSLSNLWAGAIWQEREVYDLMGINFTGFPDHPSRIFLDDDFEGYPLRKDFQWQGGRE